jgi:hypothetical protein
MIWRKSGQSGAGQYAALTSWQGTNMTQPVPDKAEIALEYPDKFYIGTFEHTSRFEAHLDPTGFALVLERPGAEDVRKSIHMHIGFGLLAGILGELAASVGRIPKQDLLHRDQLARAVGQLHQALIEA